MPESRGCRRFVLLPGMDGTGELFRPFVDALPQGWEATAGSCPVHRALGYAELADYVQRAGPQLLVRCRVREAAREIIRFVDGAGMERSSRTALVRPP